MQINRSIIFGLFFVFCFLNSKGQSFNSQEFKDRFYKSTERILLDIRNPRLYQKAHISKSVNLDFEEDDFEKKIKTYNKKSEIFLYCQNGSYSSEAYTFLTEIGFKNIRILEGGFENWVRTPMPYVSSPSFTETLSIYTSEDYKNLSIRFELVAFTFIKDDCLACQDQEKVLNEIKTKYPNLRVIKINAEDNLTLSEKLQIKEKPTLILYKSSHQIWRHTGLAKKEDLEAVL
ncbi:MAG: rhodanese-like domain-containing protein [Leadbetterella sp.]